MQHRILSQTGVLRMNQSILIDRLGLWSRFGCEEIAKSEGYEIIHFSDDMKLRHFYEAECQERTDTKRVIVIDDSSLYIPFDIKRRFPVIILDYRLIFPSLSEEALIGLPGLDYDHLAFIADNTILPKMDKGSTLRFCTEELQTSRWAEQFGDAMLDRAVILSEKASSHRDWTPVAIMFGKASMIQHSGIELRGYSEKRTIIELAFKQWISQKYGLLSGTVDGKRPVLLSKVNDFIRKNNEKVALIVMDGMAFEDFFTIQRTLPNRPFCFEVQSSFSFFPTVTSVARQSIFSGKLPREHDKPFSLENEEKQWAAYWKDHGYRANEIAYFKNETPEVSPQTKIVGIVVNICDDLMHDELQGLTGLLQGLMTWAKNTRLFELISSLQKRGFAVYMTADHGNTSASAQGRFQKPGVLAEPASRRAVIYQSYADALELEKFSTEQYSGTYLPDNFKAYLFTSDCCYGDRGKEYITHGGMTLEEAIVPFVKIGEYHG